MGSLHSASCLIPLVTHEALQRHFHSLHVGLTNRFTPPCQSDPLVPATLLREWQDLSFLTSGIPIRPFQAEFTIFMDASTQGWGAHMGDSDCGCLDPLRTPAPHECAGSNTCSNTCFHILNLVYFSTVKPTIHMHRGAHMDKAASLQNSKSCRMKQNKSHTRQLLKPWIP